MNKNYQWYINEFKENNNKNYKCENGWFADLVQYEYINAEGNQYHSLHNYTISLN